MASSYNKESVFQSPSSSKSYSQSQKGRLCLRAEKRLRNVCPSPSPLWPDSEVKEGDKIRAIVSNGGAQIVVAEPNDAIRIYAMGNFGSFVGQRMNFSNWHCFLPGSTDKAKKHKQQMQDVSESSDEQQQQQSMEVNAEGEEDGTSKRKAKENAAEWIEKTMGGGGLLHLSPEEALYLSYDLKILKLTSQQNDDYSLEQFFSDLCNFHPNFFSVLCRYIVYRHFRRLCWIVRNGISFGVDFLLYKSSVDTYHSSAGVRIIHSAHEPIAIDNSIGALQRELSNCKKRLLLANVVGLPNNLQDLRLQQLEMVDVQVLSMSVWSMNKSRILDLNGTEAHEDN